jgi:pimeloyl-ACP methyl ester carboxylesterase
VLIHGWACDLTFWSKQTPAFAGKMRVIQLDLPGHGKSDKPTDVEYTQNLFALSVNAVLEDAGVDKAVLLGHSMGSYTSRQFYRKFPEKVLALGFVDAPMQSFTLPPDALEIFVRELESPFYKTFASLFIDNMLVPNTTASMRRSVKRRMLQTPSNVMASAMYWLGDPDIYERDEINVPLFAVYKRLFLPRGNEQFLESLARDLDYQVWAGVPHFMMLVKPAKFNEEFLEFLAEHRLLLTAKALAPADGRRPRQDGRFRRTPRPAPVPSARAA